MSEQRDAIVRLSAVGGGALAIGGDVAITLTSNLAIKWFQIAVEHERVALEARDRANAAPGAARR